MAKFGERFSDEEIKRYNAYRMAGLAAPAEFDDLVEEHTDPRGPVYRHATAEEMKAGAEAVDAAAKAADEHARLNEKVRAEAAKRLGDAAVTMPAPPPKPS
jgi:lactam utilization protein B